MNDDSCYNIPHVKQLGEILDFKFVMSNDNVKLLPVWSGIHINV